jgi:uncharacterized protein (DUF4415 family)
MSRISKKAKIHIPTEAENRRIVAAAKGDPDAQPLTEKQLKAMVPMRSLRGRPKQEKTKLLVSVRYSQEVIEYFRSTGEGWQARMDEVLRRYVGRQSKARNART